MNWIWSSIINIFLLCVFVLLSPVLIINHICFKIVKNRKPLASSFIVAWLERFPWLYEFSICIWNFPIQRNIYRPLESLLKTDGIRLQVGCGTGLFNKYFSDLKVDNLDINKKYLTYGIKHGRILNYIYKSVYDIESFENSHFYKDIVFSRCFHHILHPRKALEKCVNVLEENGTIIIFDPVSERQASFSSRVINSELDGVIYNHHKKTYEKFIKKILPDGLELKSIDYIKLPTLTNYNFLYPHIDSVVVMQKRRKQ